MQCVLYYSGWDHGSCHSLIMLSDGLRCKELGDKLFISPVTALPVSYCRCLNLCTALSTSPLGYPGLPAMTCMYVVSLLPIELNILFILVLQIISTLIASSWKNGKELWNINTTVSFSVLCCFCSVGYLLHIIAHERCIYYLLTQKKAVHKTKHMSQPMFSCCVHIPSHSFQFCYSSHQ